MKYYIDLVMYNREFKIVFIYFFNIVYLFFLYLFRWYVCMFLIFNYNFYKCTVIKLWDICKLDIVDEKLFVVL